MAAALRYSPGQLAGVPEQSGFCRAATAPGKGDSYGGRRDAGDPTCRWECVS
jgi:hypothetical protein